jgi:hypothetical protein
VSALRGPEELRVVGEDKIIPRAAGVIAAFARIGYKFPEALSDIVDNSIDAGARKILIRFFCSDDAIRQIAIVDNGGGMSAEELQRGMQFGADISHGKKDLGKFGMGMKSASFSQCLSLSVLSRKGGKTAARRWTVETIEKGWTCSLLDEGDADRILDADWGDRLDLSKSGTIILWDQLDRLDRAGDKGLDYLLKKLFTSLRVHLGLVYHRFLSSRRVSIKVDALRYGQDVGGAEQLVEAIDPFKYDRSGNKHYPKTFEVGFGKVGSLDLEAHIWPPRSNLLEYKLGGQAAARQGFYFYRNDRLIQAGGWNKLRQHEAEPHLSLARVKIDLPPALDSLFHLDVQKSALDVPPSFEPALKAADRNDVTFDEYLNEAQAAYRRREAAAPENRPIVIGNGVPRAVRREVSDALGGGKKRQRKVNFKWSRLPATSLFEIERQEHLIRLNSLYRDAFEGRSRRQREAPQALIRTALFLLLKDEFNRDRVSQEVREWLELCNNSLVTALEQSD